MSIVEIEDYPPLTEKGVKWKEFIEGLESSEYHKLLVLGELDLHDSYEASEQDLMTIYGLVKQSCKCHLCRTLNEIEERE